MQSKVNKISKKAVEVQAMKNNVERENQKAKELYASTKATAGKVNNLI